MENVWKSKRLLEIIRGFQILEHKQKIYRISVTIFI